MSQQTNLVNELDVSLENFVCPCYRGQAVKSTYALNENAAGRLFSEIPDDMVLFFESKPGWNQIGGPELFFESHPGKGKFVFPKEGILNFIRKEDVGNLVWNDEEE